MRGITGSLVFIVLLLALLLLAGCAGGDSSLAEPMPQREVPQQGQSLESALSDLTALPTPDGVAIDVFSEIKEALALALAERFGDGELCTAGKLLCTPPMGDLSVSTMAFNAQAGLLIWRYYSTGDYNQDSLVSVSDITSVAQHYNERSPVGAEQPFPPDSIGAVIDGNGDGMINISDITQIAQNWGNIVAGYNIYMSSDEGDHPASSSDGNGPGTTQIGYVAFANAIAVNNERTRLEFALPADAVPGYYWVRPTDGVTDGTPSSVVQVTAADLNIAPIAVVSASPAEGLVPLTVSFHAFSSVDPDGVITRYYWDYDGEYAPLGWADTGEQGWTEYTYAAAGNYFALLKVEDNDGGTAEDFVIIRVREPTPPVAAFDCSLSSAPAPLHTSLDATASADPDGHIVRYEWDWNSNNEYNYDAGDEPLAENYYYAPGEYTITLRVTDNDGLTATATHDVVVQEAAMWHTELAVSAVLNLWEDGTSRIREISKVIDADGHPALFLNKDTYVGGDWIDSLHYIRALDAYGTTWEEAVELAIDNKPLAELGDNYYGTSIQGRPAIYYEFGPSYQDADLYYLLADDEAGSSWPDPLLMEEGQTLPSNTSMVNGQLMFFGIHSINNHVTHRSTDGLGFAWESTNTELLYFASKSQIVEVQGKPAFGLRYQDDLLYIRSFDANGVTWPGFPLILDSIADVEHTPSMVLADGRPIISYYDNTLRRLMLIHAEDAAGESWGEPQALAHWTEGRQAMTLWQGRPVVMYQDYNTEGYMLIIANNEEGTNWGLPFIINIDYPAFPDSYPPYYIVSWLSLVGDRLTVTLGYNIQIIGTPTITHTGSGIVMYH